MNDCIFCKILKNEIPSHKVYEDKYTMAFLDIAPVSKGHILVMPKEHVTKLEDIDEVMLDAVMNTVQKIGKTLKKSLGVDGYNIIVNDGAVAGQVIDHLHFHIIPRKKGDGLEPWLQGKYENDDAGKVAEKIAAELEK